jgi:hypothetical protein
MPGSSDTPTPHPLTAEEQRQLFAAIEQAKRLCAADHAEDGDTPGEPSWKLINEARDERTRQVYEAVFGSQDSTDCPADDKDGEADS